MALAYPNAESYLSRLRTVTLQSVASQSLWQILQKRLSKPSLPQDPASSVYGDLDLRSRDFRLVRIVEDAGTLSFEMRQFSLENPPDYIALSYCWGTEDATCVIEVNGQDFWVRPNLYDYLDTAAGECQYGWYFIDAICINQSSQGQSAEKEHQISLMSSIYGQANTVEAWVGILDHFDIHESSQFMAQVQAKMDSMSQWDFSDVETVFQRITPPDEIDLAMMGWFEAVSLSSYWCRLWVTQEMLLARHLIIRSRSLRSQEHVFYYLNKATNPALGFIHTVFPPQKEILDQEWPGWFDPVEMELGSLGRQARFARAGCHADPLQGHEPPMRANCILGFRMLSHHYGYQIRGMRVTTCFNAFGSLDCTLPHDKVFGLLAVEHQWLDVDYEMSLAELYMRLLVEAFVDCEFRRGGLPCHDEISGFYQALAEAFLPLIGFRASMLPLLILQEISPSSSLILGSLMGYCPSWGKRLFKFLSLFPDWLEDYTGFVVGYSLMKLPQLLLLPYKWACSMKNCQMPSINVRNGEAKTYLSWRKSMEWLISMRIRHRIILQRGQYRSMFTDPRSVARFTEDIVNLAFILHSPILVLEVIRMIGMAIWEIDEAKLRSPSTEDEEYFAALMHSMWLAHWALATQAGGQDPERFLAKTNDPENGLSEDPGEDETHEQCVHQLQVIYSAFVKTSDGDVHAAMQTAIDVRNRSSADLPSLGDFSESDFLYTGINFWKRLPAYGSTLGRW